MSAQLYSLTGMITFGLRLMVGWACFSEKQIHNYYVAKVKLGKHGFVIPLGGNAEPLLNDEEIIQLPDRKYTLALTDISGTVWKQDITK